MFISFYFLNNITFIKCVKVVSIGHAIKSYAKLAIVRHGRFFLSKLLFALVVSIEIICYAKVYFNCKQLIKSTQNASNIVLEIKRIPTWTASYLYRLNDPTNEAGSWSSMSTGGLLLNFCVNLSHICEYNISAQTLNMNNNPTIRQTPT